MARTWLVTGASGGLGRELVEAALEHGDRVVATSRRPEQLGDLAAAHRGRLLSVALDVTDPDAARGVVARAVEEFGSLDVVVNNAGYATIAPTEEFDEQEFRAQIEANLFGVVNVTRAALPVLRRQRSGHVLQISSVGGRVGGSAGLSAYQTAKFGVAGFSEVLATEVAPLGIRVTVVEPGAMRTGWAAGATAAQAPVGADYEGTVGAGFRLRAGFAGNEPGDPARVAKVLVGLVESGEAPRRLLIGSDALEITRRHTAERSVEMEEWAAVSRSTDFSPTPDPTVPIGGSAEAEPFVFIATNKVREGASEEERLRAPGWVEFIRRNEPRLIAFHEYLSADGAEAEFVQVHPDVESFEHHMRVLAERSDPSYTGTLDGTTGIRIYGTPSAAVLEMLARAAGPDVTVTVLSDRLAGFTRA